MGSQQWRSKRLEKLCVFRSIGLDRNHPKLTGRPGGSAREGCNPHLEKGKKEDLVIIGWFGLEGIEDWRVAFWMGQSATSWSMER